MTKHGTVRPSQKQTAEFHSTVITALPELTPEQMQAWIGKKKALQMKLRELFVGAIEDEKSSRFAKPAIWSDVQALFYKEVFGLTVDFSEVKLPPKTFPKTFGFGWTLAIAKELGDKPLATAMAACKKLFGGNAHQYTDDLDNAVSTNDRTPTNGSYAVCVRDRVEADEENKNLSADTIKSRNMVTMTLLERVILELFYFWKTGKHLDIQNWTLCSGSHSSGDNVPRCGWSGGGFMVGWEGPDDSSGSLRSRSAVI